MYVYKIDLRCREHKHLSMVLHSMMLSHLFKTGSILRCKTSCLNTGRLASEGCVDIIFTLKLSIEPLFLSNACWWIKHGDVYFLYSYSNTCGIFHLHSELFLLYMFQSDLDLVLLGIIYDIVWVKLCIDMWVYDTYLKIICL